MKILFAVAIASMLFIFIGIMAIDFAPIEKEQIKKIKNTMLTIAKIIIAISAIAAIITIIEHKNELKYIATPKKETTKEHQAKP